MTKSCVGIITVPLSPDKKYYKVCGDSFISLSHINILKRLGMDTVAIPYTTDRHEYYMDRINGLYFPSGGVFASNNEEYYRCCKRFTELAIAKNDSGIHFPVLGICMGMQQMMMIADSHGKKGNDNLELLETFDSFDNLLLTLEFPEDPRSTRLFRNISSDLLYRLQTEECTVNNHKMGLSPRTFSKNPGIDSFYRIISTSRDRQGVVFVSTMEARNYPFYGFQWHPERDDSMDTVISVFAYDAAQNKRNKTIANKDKLPYRKVHCMQYSGNIYKYCRFYWHNRSSFHNAQLCSVLNLGRPADSGV